MDQYVASSSIRFRRLLIGILVLAFGVRAGAMIIMKTYVFPSDRAFGYETGEIGYAIANGQGFSFPKMDRAVGSTGEHFAVREAPMPTTWEAPVYPFIVAVVFWCLGSFTPAAAVVLELFQVALSLLACWMLFVLGKRLFNEQTGLLAAFIFALYPVSIHFSVQKVEYAPLLTFLGLVLVHGTLELSKRPSIARSLRLGAIAGFATLVNPVIIAFYPFGILWFLAKCQSSWTNLLKYSAAIVLCCGAMMAPWLIRNYLVFDRFVFIRPNFSRELVLANYPESSLVEAVGAGDGELSKAYNQEAWSLIVERPARMLQPVVNRVNRFWLRLGVSGARDQLIVAASYYPVALLGLVGVWLARRHPQGQLLIIYLLAMPIPFYLTWAARSRFRYPIEPVLILFASYAVTAGFAVISRWLRREQVTAA